MTDEKTAAALAARSERAVADVIARYSRHLYAVAAAALRGIGAEQDAEEWWNAMCTTTKEIFTKTDIKPEQIAGISFCSQMQALVLVDKNGDPVRRPMSYMDQRAKEELKKYMAYGLQEQILFRFSNLLPSREPSHAA